MNENIPRSFPLTSIWKEQLIKERIKIEMKEGFGRGLVLDRMQIQQESPKVRNEGCSSTPNSDGVMVIIFLTLCCVLVDNFK